ncbi:restriction endonuclease subunit S [Flavobacterium adhaerens]|uniref:restriction endonuclease subunit S n=1 Tax=Flavobacterium adhaerens TaxID=3149043 RepID=UPI0032B585CE
MIAAIKNSYEGYKDSGVEWLGQIPEHWELTRLGSYFIERKTKVSDKDYAPLSVTKNGILPQLENAAKSNDGDNRKLVKKGDFVINSRSDRKGSSGIAYEDGSVSLINIVMKPLNINPVFCNYLLKSTAFVEENYRIGHGIVADLWTTRYDEMKNIKIGIPTAKEQTAIAAFLDYKTAKLDQAIAIKEQQIALLKERKQIIIQQAVTKGVPAPLSARAESRAKLKDSGVEWIGEIPEHWETIKFKYIIRTKARLGWKGLKAHEYVDESEFKFLSTPNIKHVDIDFQKAYHITKFRYEESPEIMLELGDVLLVKDGSTLGISNIVKYLPSKCTVNSSIAVLKIGDKNILDPFYLNYFLKSTTMQNLIELKKDGMGVPHLFQSDINNFSVLILPIDEQKMIVEYIEAQSSKVDQAVSIKEQEIEKLKEYKMSLIDAVVTGKVRVC